MKAIKIFIILTATIFIFSSCSININYPENGIVDYITKDENTDAPEETAPSDTANSPDTTGISDTGAVTNIPQVTEKPTTPTIPSNDDSNTDTVSPDTQTPPQTTAEETSAYVPEIYLYHLTSPISKNQTATLSIIGQPNTEYSIAVYYATGKSSAKGLENKISSDIGAVSWSWKIGPSVKTGYYRIVITGGGRSLETEIQVY